MDNRIQIVCPTDFPSPIKRFDNPPCQDKIKRPNNYLFFSSIKRYFFFPTQCLLVLIA